MRSISEIRRNLRIGTETVNRILREKGIVVKWEGRKKGISDEDYKSVENFVKVNQSKSSSKYWMVAYEYGEVIPVSQAASSLRIGVARLKKAAKELDIPFIEGGQARFITRARYEKIRKHLGLNADNSTRGWITPAKPQPSLFEDEPSSSTKEKPADFSRFKMEDSTAQKAIKRLKEKVNADEKINYKKEKSKKTKEQELSAKVFDLDSENRLLIQENIEKDEEIKALRSQKDKLKKDLQESEKAFKDLSASAKKLKRDNEKWVGKVKQLEQVKYAIDTLVRISERSEL